MIFLLGRQAMLGQEPPTYFRSMTATFIPFLASVHERSLPAVPLPRMSRSYSSALIVDAALPLVASLSKCCVVSMPFSCLVIRTEHHSWRAAASPMPEVPQVTKATLFFSEVFVFVPLT